MRTKTLLLAAAVAAVGTGAAMAQTVYSVNAVGYVNITVKNNYNLICNPLNGTNNNINTIMPVAPADSLAVRWSTASQSFVSTDTYFATGDPATEGWYDATEAKSSTVLNPGEAFFFKNQSGVDATLTFVGEVPQGNLNNGIAPLYGFYSSIVPRSAALETVGFPGRADMLYLTFNPVSQSYVNTLTYFATGVPETEGWYDATETKVSPIPAVGQGFLIYNPPANGSLNWNTTFSVN